MSKEKKMHDVVLEFRESGLSRKVFCEQRGINLHTFVYWLGKLRQADSVSGFISVQGLSKKSVSDIELEYPNGVKLRVATAGDLAVLRQLIELY